MSAYDTKPLFSSEAQRARVVAVLLRAAGVEVKPDPHAVGVWLARFEGRDDKPAPGRVSTLVRCAQAFWNGAGKLQLGELLLGLAGFGHTRFIFGLLGAIASGHARIDGWLLENEGSMARTPRDFDA